MPAINRTRLVNTKYNDGKNYYDDFILKLGGAHTLIDMINGLGKTFFLQCMAQPMLPNAKFKQEFPISLLFDKNNDNNTIHSLVEWQLDPGSSFKYALIGFCAYKKEKIEQLDFADEEESGEFGTLLYVCYYNAPNAYDIEGIPLSTYKDENTKKVMNYRELEKYLKNLQASQIKDYAVVIHRTKKEHLKTLASLNINSVEWHHLMGINASEANAEKYLRSYTTASSFIQDFLIPTIEKSYQLRHEGDYQNEESRAKTLMQLRQTLVTLQQKEALEEEYLYIEEACQRIYEQLGILERQFSEKEGLVQRISELSDCVKESKIKTEEEKIARLKEISILELLLKQQEEKIKDLDLEENAYGIKEASQKLEVLKNAADKSNALLSQNEEKLLQLQDKRNEYEAEKLYREYLVYAQKKSIQEEAYEARSKEHAELVADYSYWGNIYGNCLLKKLRLKESEKRKVEEELKLLKMEEDQSKLKKERLLTEVNYYTQQITQKEEAILSKKVRLSELQKHFKHLTKEHLVAALEDQKQLVAKNQEERANYQDILELIKETKAKELMEEKLSDVKLRTTLEQKESLQKNINEMLLAKNEIGLLEDRYQTSELDTYFAQNRITLREQVAKRKRQCEAITKRLKAIEVGEGVVLSDCALKQFERIAHQYPSALLGNSFLENKTLPEKKRLLEQTTLLPYSIIVDDSDFNKLKEDYLLLRELEGEVVPIINQKVLMTDQSLSIEGLCFTSNDIDYFIDAELKEKEVKKLKKESINCTEALRRYEEQLKQLENAHHLLFKMTHLYSASRLEEQENLLNEIIEQESEIKSCLLDIKEKQEALDAEQQNLELIHQQAVQQAVFLEEELMRLEEEWACLMNWEEQHSEKERLVQEVDELREVVTCTNNQLIALDETLQQLKQSCLLKELSDQALLEEVVDLRMQVRNFSFEIEEDERYSLKDIAFEEAKAKYELYEKRLSTEAGDVKLLEQTIKDALEGMKQKKQELLTKGSHFTLGYFEGKTVLEGDCTAHVGLIVTQIQELTERLQRLKQEATQKRDAFISSQGALGNMKEQFKKTFGRAYEEIKLNEGIIADELIRIAKEKTITFEQIKQTKNQIIQNEKLKNQLEKEAYKLIDKLQKLNALVYKYQLTLKPTTKRTIDLNYFDQAENEIEQVLSRLTREQNIYIQLLKEVLEKLEAPELVYFKGDLDRLLTELPTDEISCQHYRKLIGGESGYLDNLREEKERIKQTIIELKKDEESFIVQCIQKCEQLYNDLMSLSELSKIELYGHTQEMIRIVVTPLEEDLRFAKMRSYINSLIEQVEHIEENRKQAYLASQLTLKELFSAFVVNIKKSDVRIFKVEELAENSRELPWSRAIGSTGQSNGMYMSIFICLISYIRKLYNPHIGEDSRKFIMLDSPFSGTAAAYIWEPVIKLLDRNNVQLLCVGYDIPSHLMSLFDVKYNLAAEYDADKKQTIVVENIKSKMNLDELSYGKFIGKQLTFDI